VSRVEARLAALGVALAEAEAPSQGRLFPWVVVRGERVFVSGHGPLEAEGRLSGPFGRVGAEVSVEEGRELARLAGVSILGSLKRALGDLDRVTGWCRVLGMVHVAPGFTRTPEVIDGASRLILDAFGPQIGAHARSAVGMAALPSGMAVEIEAELLVA